MDRLGFDRVGLVTVPWYEDEAGFVSELERGRRGELRVFARIAPLGLWQKLGYYWRVKDDPRAADQPDIMVEGGHLLEVKSRDLPFTSPEDYPYDTAFVGARRRWEQRTDLPCAVVLLSEQTGALLAVSAHTRDQWVTVQAEDRRRGFLEESLAAPRSFLMPEHRLMEHLQRPCPIRMEGT